MDNRQTTDIIILAVEAAMSTLEDVAYLEDMDDFIDGTVNAIIHTATICSKSIGEMYKRLRRERKPSSFSKILTQEEWNDMLARLPMLTTTLKEPAKPESEENPRLIKKAASRPEKIRRIPIDEDYLLQPGEEAYEVANSDGTTIARFVRYD